MLSSPPPPHHQRHHNLRHHHHLSIHPFPHIHFLSNPNSNPRLFVISSSSSHTQPHHHHHQETPQPTTTTATPNKIFRKHNAKSTNLLLHRLPNRQQQEELLLTSRGTEVSWNSASSSIRLVFVLFEALSLYAFLAKPVQTRTIWFCLVSEKMLIGYVNFLIYDLILLENGANLSSSIWVFG